MAEFSVILWGNDEQLVEGLAIPSLTPPWQRGPHTVQTVCVNPEGGARNMGQAYNGGAALAQFPIKIYAHQDIVMEDRTYLTRLSEMFSENPDIGLIGIVGSTIDTGASFFQAPAEYKLGEVPRDYPLLAQPGSFFPKVHGIEAIWNTRFAPRRARVKVVDCLLFATNMDIPFAECYLKTHMVAEDYCMRVREAGKQVWIIDSLMEHFSSGTVDVTYWESVRTFRRKWRHMLPADLPSVDTFKGVYYNQNKDAPGWERAWQPEQLEAQMEVARSG